MPSIRFPSTALPLLPLCKGHGTDFIFRTYADLIGFVAAYGFYLVTHEGQHLPAKVTFSDTPNAVGLEVFENRGIYPNFIIMAFAHDPSREIAEDDEALSEFIERLCAIGAESINLRINNYSIIQICGIISDTLNKNQIIKI